MKAKRLSKLTAWLLTFAMLMTFLPGVTFTSFAADGDGCAVDGCGGAYTNGFCSNDSTHYEEAHMVSETYHSELSTTHSGYYAIENAGQLYWFASYVDGGNYSVDAVLTDNITVNENLLSEKITVASDYTAVVNEGESVKIWNPIGGKSSSGALVQYEGIFDGNGHTVSGLYYNDASDSKSDSYIALVGYIRKGTIKNVGVIDSYIYCFERASGICGDAYYGDISNCYSQGYFYATYRCAGGISGAGDCVISNCYSLAYVDVQTGAYIGAISGSAENTTNCYYLSGTCSSGGGGTAKNKDAFTNGEVTYLLNNSSSEGSLIWGQTLKTDSYPVFGGPAVYKITTTTCDNKESSYYSNDNTGNIVQTHSYTNGFCTNCGTEEPAETISDEKSEYNGYYQIGNAGQLLWFAQAVNSGSTSINGVLTADINLEDIAWAPIGNEGNIYTGTFDGQNHKIEGMKIDITADTDNIEATNKQGLFGYISDATIKDFDIYGELSFSYSEGADTSVIASDYAGAVAYSAGASTISGIDSYVNLTFADTAVVNTIGGVAGAIYDTTIVEACAYYGTIKAGISFNNIAGIAAYSHTAGTTIKNCGFYGDIISYGASTTDGTNDNRIQMGGIIGYVCSDSFVMENCLVAGTLSAPNATDKSGVAAFGNIRQNAAANIKNNYYAEGLTGIGTKFSDYNGGALIAATAKQLAGGEAAYLLGSAWGQAINRDTYPVLNGAAVYKVGVGLCSATEFTEHTYSNSNKAQLTHDSAVEYENGFCPHCGAYQAAVLTTDKYDVDGDSACDSVYEISNAGQLYWFAARANGGNHYINGVLTDNITVNQNLLTELITVADDFTATVNDGKNVRSWTPIGRRYNVYMGTFDGQGFNISGLYCNTPADDVGLFGFYLGTTKNLCVKDSYFCGRNYVGAIAGTGANTEKCISDGNVVKGDYFVGGVCGSMGSGTMSDCFNSSIVSGRAEVGGIVGSNDKGANETVSPVIKNSLNVGNVSGSSMVGGVCGIADEVVIQDCYYLSTTASAGIGENYNGTSTITNVEAKSAKQLASGEVAYLLQARVAPEDIYDEEGNYVETIIPEVWGQMIDIDEYPVLGGEKVYKYGDTYSNEAVTAFEIESHGAQGSKATAEIAIPTAGTYTVIFVDYEDGKLKNLDTVTKEFELGLEPVTSEKDITLGIGDKIMLFENTTALKPLCNAYVITE